jgi:hypothetical protein
MYAASLLTTIFGQDMQMINLIIRVFFVWFKLSNKPVLISSLNICDLVHVFKLNNLHIYIFFVDLHSW